MFVISRVVAIAVPVARIVLKLLFGGGFGVGVAIWRMEVGGWRLEVGGECLVRGG